MGGGKRDKTTGLPLPTPVVPSSSVCVTIPIPNALEYRSAFKGVLSELGKPWNWSQTVGQDNQASYAAAEMWREIIANIEYQIDCGDTMSCDDIANCIESSSAVQQAIVGIVPTVPIDGYAYPPGVPLTPSQMTAPLNEIDDCAFDAFWAQVQQYIDYMIDLGGDVLEQIEAYSAALDAGENVPMGQFLGKLKNSSTAGKVIDFLQWVLTVVKAAYEAADNAANRNAIKCALFCAQRDACVISIQATLDVLNERMGGLLTPDDLNDLPSLVDAFTTAAFNPALALDLWVMFLMGAAKTAGMFGLQGIDETLQLVLAVAVNDANNDWELLCEDCDPEPVDLALEIDPDGINGDGGAPHGIVEEIGPNQWRIYATDLIGAVRSVGLVPFRIVNRSIDVVCQGWKGPSSAYANGCDGAWVYNDEAVTRMYWAGGGWTYVDIEIAPI